ncbi:acyl-CoA dehydrogenase family protein [Nocardia thailandica]
MTTVDVAAVLTHLDDVRSPIPSSADPTVESLRTAVLGSSRNLHRQVRDRVASLGDRPRSGLTYGAEAALAPELLRGAITALGGSAAAISADPRLRGVLCEWAAVFAPHLLPVLTGHLDLAIGAILALGNGSPYQAGLLAELDSGAAVGELLLTELGGTNGADQQTTATWDSTRGGFWLDSPTSASWKFMPNIADAATAKVGVVTARVLVDGRDEGVLPLLVAFRTAGGELAPGLHVQALPDKAWAPMDHAMIRFNALFVPVDALLGGDWAVMGARGLDCAIAPRERFHRAIAALSEGRLDLAGAAAAGARAGVALTLNYARQRRPGGRIAMVERGTVRRDLVSGIAATYAISILARRVQSMRVTAEPADPLVAVWSMLAKPLTTYTAHQVLLSCRQRAAAQGSLRTNWLQDWLGATEGIITAEGESQLLWKQAGRSGEIAGLRLPATPAHLPWWIRMLADREQVIAAGLRRGDFTAAGVAVDLDTAAVELAAATSERLAATATFAAALAASDPRARELLESAAAVYALERLDSRGGWYAAHRQLSPRRAGSIHHELHRHRHHLGEHLDVLAEGFDIDLGLLDAPMASADYLGWWQNWAGWPSSRFGPALRIVGEQVQ